MSAVSNASAPFSLDEYDAVFKKPKCYPCDLDEYKDFKARAFPSPDANPLISVADGQIDLDQQL